MDKRDIIEYFDGLAPSWDAHLVHNDEIINKILDRAEVFEDVTVLDVACGTGALFQDYINRNVKTVMGVDISPVMIEYARKKASDPRIRLVVGDIEETAISERFDRCVVYNAFPHFSDPVRLIGALADRLKPHGRLTIAHSMSRAALDRHHTGLAGRVSMRLMSEDELGALMSAHFDVDAMISDDEKFIVSGVKRA